MKKKVSLERDDFLQKVKKTKKSFFSIPRREERKDSASTRRKYFNFPKREANQTIMTYFIVITAFAHFFMFVNSMTGKLWRGEQFSFLFFSTPSENCFFFRVSENFLLLVLLMATCFALEFLRFTFLLMLAKRLDSETKWVYNPHSLPLPPPTCERCSFCWPGLQAPLF